MIYFKIFMFFMTLYSEVNYISLFIIIISELSQLEKYLFVDISYKIKYRLT